MWKVEYYTGSEWTEKSDAVFKKIYQELNGHEECSFVLPNTSDNRTFVSSDKKIRILYGSEVVFEGLLVGAEYSEDLLVCFAYPEAYVKMDPKIIPSGSSHAVEYVGETISNVLQAICDEAGVQKGECPSGTVSVRFIRSNCLKAAQFLADAVNKDFWADWDASLNPRFNIGTRQEHTNVSVDPLEWPKRIVDRSQKIEKVIVRSVDKDGNYIEGSAGTGDKVAVFTEKGAMDIDTLNTLAQKKLNELNTESSGVTLPLKVTQGYNLYPGDTVKLNKPELGWEEEVTYRVLAVTKTIDKVKIEVEKKVKTLDKELEDFKKYEEYGIYPIYEEQAPALDDYFHKEKDDVTDIKDEVPPPPTFTVQVKEIDTETVFRTWLEITINVIENAGGYIIGYRKPGQEWIHIQVAQPSSGSTVTVATPDLEEDTIYEVHVCAVSKLGQFSDWSDTVTVATAINNMPPEAPTNLTRINTVNGVLLQWDPVYATDLSHYIVYYGTSDPPTNIAGETVRPYFFWKKKEGEDYTTYYFAVSAVDTGNRESDKSESVQGKPLQIAPLDLQIESRPWTADFKMWEDEDESNYGTFYWAAGDGSSDPVIKFADGSTHSINKNLTGYAPSETGLWYCYWTKDDNDLHWTQDYSEAVGEGKGLLVIVDRSTDKRSTIVPFNSYSPTIGAGAIAAQSILATHIKSGVINTDHITSDPSLMITSKQIVFDGTTTFLDTWRHGSKTTIDGGMIEAETITATQLKAKSITADKLLVGVQNEVPDGSFELGDATSEWTGGTAQSTEVYEGSYALELSGGSEVFTRRFIPVKAGKVYHLEGAIKSSLAGYSGIISIYWYDLNTNEISHDTLSSTSSAWTVKEGEFTAPSNAYFAKIKLRSESVTHYFDAIKLWQKSSSVDIQDGCVTTSHIRFNALDLDPANQEIGMTWYNYKDNLIKFVGRDESGNKLLSYIPRYPLTDVSAPPENLLSNQSFETDRDGDGVPDFWEFTWENNGDGEYGDDEANHVKGSKSAYIHQTNSTGHGAYRSSFILVHGGKKYYASVYVKVSEGTETFNPLAIEWFDKDKNFINASDMDNKEIGESFTLCELEATAPSNARYARIYLGNRGISGKWVYFDDVVFSEIRGAKSTEVSHSLYGGVYQADTISANSTERKTVSTLTPDKQQFLFATAYVWIQGGDTIWDAVIHFQLKNTTDNKVISQDTKFMHEWHDATGYGNLPLALNVSGFLEPNKTYELAIIFCSKDAVDQGVCWMLKCRQLVTFEHFHR